MQGALNYREIGFCFYTVNMVIAGNHTVWTSSFQSLILKAYSNLCHIKVCNTKTVQVCIQSAHCLRHTTL